MRIFNKLKDTRGFVTTWRYAVKYWHMITDKAKHKTRVLAFWQKHGLKAALDAFPHKRSTLFLWKKKLKQGNGRLESLNDRSKAPVIRRKRLWSQAVINEIKRLRQTNPNLGKDKIYPLLKEFCESKSFKCPMSSTIGRIIGDDPDKMRIFPVKVSHFGKIKPIKRQAVLRKPKGLKAEYPGQVVALDTIERFVHGLRRYIITFEDIHSRFGFAWSTTSHASLAAQEFFQYCLKVFPYPIAFILTDNGSEFKKHFSEELKRLHLIHYHTYPKMPKMNAHCERFNRTIKEEFVDYHAYSLINPNSFNLKLMDWLIWYNTKRVHHTFQNKLSPLQYIMSLQTAKPLESKMGWTYTKICLCQYFVVE